jgi:hypothetical protein
MELPVFVVLVVGEDAGDVAGGVGRVWEER